ncbi:ankyrin unc44 [Colletotrichum chrysophilum]|uniref:Ankyrin unc44 n=1 Tax=Colletotrichum chrysophilum TaxID=1836956 RepID=A0AAD9ANA3_9PEZI|nr:ankyrin unc44 [Colletotrichum chrysophilum]
MHMYYANSSDAWQSWIDLDYLPHVAGTWTPLHLAICRGNQSIARFLVSRGASLCIRYNRRMDIPRSHGVATLFFSKSCDLLTRMTHLGSVDIEDSSDDDLDHRGTIMALEEVEDHNRMDAAHSAAASGQREILRYLIAKGTDINTFDGSNGNVLHYALSESDTDMCKLVVGLGTDTATPIEFAVRNMNGSSIVSVVEWAANYCPGKTEVISRALSHIAERGDSFWKVDEGSGKTMVISSIFDFGCYNDELMEPEYNKWISQFLQGAILTCDLSNAGNLEEELLLCFAINATSLTSGPDVLDMILDATGSLRALFYGDSQKLDMKKVVFPNTPVWRRLGEGQVEPANELGTLLIQDLNEWVNVTDSMVQTDWKQRRLKRARDMIDWLLDHGATPPKP